MLSLVQGQSPASPLSEAALRQFVVKALDKGWVREGFHSEVERADRHISHDDIIYGLDRSWVLLEARAPSESWHTGYSYKLQTVDLEDEELILVICPNLTNQTLKVATKY
jgi:hypothetical protein